MIAAMLLIVAFMGFMLFFMGYVDPFMHMILMDWVGAILMLMAPIGYFVTLYTSQTIKRFDPIPKNKALLDFIRRDGLDVDVIGTRIYSGQSFLDTEGLGLIEDLGKDCVFLKSKKKIRYVLENLSFTQDPRFWGFTSELYRLGFNTSDDVYNVLNGLDPELMAQVYLNILKYREQKGAKRLIEELKASKPKPAKRFKIMIPKRKKVEQQMVKEVKQQVRDRHKEIEEFLEKQERER